MPQQQQLNRAWLLDNLRFYRTHLRNHRFYRLAEQAHEMVDYVLDLGMHWPDAVPSVRIFIAEADDALRGRRLLQTPRY